MTGCYQPLEAARTYLRVLCRMADDAGDWQERRLLGPLHDVADMVCRIGEYGDSDRYRADKAGTLVGAALKLRSVALERYAGTDENDQEFSKVLGLQEGLDNAISRVMWVLAGWKRNNGGELWRSDAEDLRLALRRLSDWAETITELALPDPDASKTGEA